MLTLVLGGARSGKSTYALSRAGDAAGTEVAYIATCLPADEEMRRRIARHRAARPPEWPTIEEPVDLPEALAQAGRCGAKAVIIDCLTLWLSNLLDVGMTDEQTLNSAEEAARAAEELGRRLLVVAVSNELGLGLVPGTDLGRRFRDLHGCMNQCWARQADEVALMIAGLPLWVKERGRNHAG